MAKDSSRSDFRAFGNPIAPHVGKELWSFRRACGFSQANQESMLPFDKDQDGFRVPPANSAGGRGMTR